MSAASNSESRKRRMVAADPVEIVAQVEFDRTGPWYVDGKRVEWGHLAVASYASYKARYDKAAETVAALRAAGLLTPP